MAKTHGTCHGKFNYIDMANISHGPWQNEVKIAMSLKVKLPWQIIDLNFPWQKRVIFFAMMCELP